MAVPRNRLSHARKNSRRAHHAKSPRSLAPCKNCNALKMAHRVCPSCGEYAGRVVVAQKSEE